MSKMANRCGIEKFFMEQFGDAFTYAIVGGGTATATIRGSTTTTSRDGFLFFAFAKTIKSGHCAGRKLVTYIDYNKKCTFLS